MTEVKYLEKLRVNSIWGLGIGDWGLGNPQSPIPNPQKLVSSIT